VTLPPWDDEASDPAQCELLAALVRCAKPRVVVEAGTYRGHGAIAIADALARNGPTGHLWTADPYDFHQPKILSGRDNITYCREDFLTMLARLDSVDFAYIDASDFGPNGRDASLRVKHFEAVLPKLSPGALVLVDDTLADDWSDGEGGRSVLRIRERCFNLRFLRGLSIFQAPA
jgi:predicted O-methyltransferase YrrM